MPFIQRPSSFSQEHNLSRLAATQTGPATPCKLTRRLWDKQCLNKPCVAQPDVEVCTAPSLDDENALSRSSCVTPCRISACWQGAIVTFCLPTWSLAFLRAHSEMIVLWSKGNNQSQGSAAYRPHIFRCTGIWASRLYVMRSFDTSQGLHNRTAAEKKRT